MNSDELLKWYKLSLESQLKPCPFCGQVAKNGKIAVHVPNKDGKEDVTCLNCGAKIERSLNIGVVSAWNKRN